MAAYRRVHDSRYLQADCQEPGSAPEPYARQSSMGYLYLFTRGEQSGEGNVLRLNEDIRQSIAGRNQAKDAPTVQVDDLFHTRQRWITSLAVLSRRRSD